MAKRKKLAPENGAELLTEEKELDPDAEPGGPDEALDAAIGSGPVAREVRLIPMEEIERCALNRKIEPKSDKIKKLAESIRVNGLINAIQLLSLQGGKYMIFAGERRYWACKIHLGWADMPAIVRDDLTAEEARELIIVDNLERQDLTPMEEARGIRELLARGSTVQQIADRLQQTVSWVMRREKLADLSDKWVAVAEKPEGLAMWTASHFEVIARFEKNIQDEIYEDMILEFGSSDDDNFRVAEEIRGLSVRELKCYVEEYTLELKRAPWKLDDALYPGGACLDCVKRSGANPGLFDKDETKKGDQCLDRACWKERLKRWLLNREGELREKHPDMIILSQHKERAMGTELFGKAPVEEWRMNSAKKTDTGAVPAFNISKHQLQWVVPDTVTGVRAVEKAQGGATPLAERRKKLEKRRRLKYWEHVVELLTGVIEGRSRKVIDSVGSEEIQCAAGAFGVRVNLHEFFEDEPWNVDKWELYRHHNETVSDKEVFDTILRGVAVMMQGGISQFRYHSEFSEDDTTELDNIMEFFHQDQETVKKEIEEKIKEPKGWGLLNEDGTVKKD